MKQNDEIIKVSLFGQNWNIINTKNTVLNMATRILQKGIRQDRDYSKYEKYSLAISYIYASCLFADNKELNEKIECFKHANQFKDIIVDKKEEAINVIMEEINKGNPVIAQIKEEEANRFIVIVGFKEVRTKKKIEENDLLIMDSYDGKIKNIDSKAMHIVNGKEINKYYDGYYLKTIVKKM